MSPEMTYASVRTVLCGPKRSVPMRADGALSDDARSVILRRTGHPPRIRTLPAEESLSRLSKTPAVRLAVAPVSGVHFGGNRRTSHNDEGMRRYWRGRVIAFNFPRR
jgi:hypothetical protein